MKIVTDSWWLYWPMAYLAAEQPAFRCCTETSRDRKWPATRTQWSGHSTFSSLPLRAEQQRPAPEQVEVRRTVIVDYSGRPLLNLFQADGKSPQNN